MRIIKLLVVSAGLLLPMAASAGGTKESGAKQDGTETVVNSDKLPPAQKVICRREEVIGSRLHAKKVCKTQAQWEYEQKEQRQTVEKGQQQRTFSNSGG